MKRQWMALGVLLLAAATQWRCAGTGTPAMKEKAAPAAVTELTVKAAPVSMMDWPVSIMISGSLRSQSTVDIKSEVAGKLIAINFEEGDQVKRDQLLAEIDPANYQLAHDQAVAALGVAQAGLDRILVTLDHARREKERADNLLRTGGITEKDRQAAVTGVKEAESQAKLSEAQIGQARTVVTIAEKALKDCRIFSPADGQVRRKFLDRGSLLAPGTPIYTLVDNARLELECPVPSHQLAAIRIGQRATFTTPTWGERIFEGTVSALNPMVEADNRSIKVILKIANPGGELRSGMFARGDIQVRIEKDACVIPRSAFVVEQEQATEGSVFVVAGGKAQRRTVQVGGARKDLLWISRGLVQGDLVIIDIGPSLRDGRAVRIGQDHPAGER